MCHSMKRAVALALAVVALRADAAVVVHSADQKGLAAAGVVAELAESSSAPAVALETARSWHFWLPSPMLHLLHSAFDGHRVVSFISFNLPGNKAAEGPSNAIDGSKQPAPSPLVDLVVSLVLLMTLAIWSGLVYLVGSKYLEHVKVKAAPTTDASAEEGLTEFKHGLCGCMSAPQTSLWACLCPCIRWADSISTMGILRNFWLAVLVWYGMMMLNADKSVQEQRTQSNAGAGVPDFTPLVIFALLGAAFRHELRLKFKMASGASVFVLDTIVYGCCPCCAIVQDAQQVDEAAQLGHPAVVTESKESA